MLEYQAEHSTPLDHFTHSTTSLVLMLCGDVQSNPGPRRFRGSSRANPRPCSASLHSFYPCGYCQEPVTWSTPGVCCGSCNVWFHAPCVDLSQSAYSLLGHESQTWHCYHCNTHNNLTVYHQYNIVTRNSFAALSLSDNDNVFHALASPGPPRTLDAQAPAPQPKGSTCPNLPRTSPGREPVGPPSVSFAPPVHSSPGPHLPTDHSSASSFLSSIPSSISALSSVTRSPVCDDMSPQSDGPAESSSSDRSSQRVIP